MAASASASDDALQQLSTFEAAFVALEAQLEPFLATSQRDLYTQAVHAVFICYLRAAGAAEDSHASKAAERVRLYEKKVRKLESERWLAQNSAQRQINMAAANRFIRAAIPDLTTTQRAALKAATSQAREQRRRADGRPSGAKRKASAAEEAEAFLAGELGAGGAAGTQVAAESDSAATGGCAAGTGGMAAADGRRAAKQRRRQG